MSCLESDAVISDSPVRIGRRWSLRQDSRNGIQALLQRPPSLCTISIGCRLRLIIISSSISNTISRHPRLHRISILFILSMTIIRLRKFGGTILGLPPLLLLPKGQLELERRILPLPSPVLLPPPQTLRHSCASIRRLDLPSQISSLIPTANSTITIIIIINSSSTSITSRSIIIRSASLTNAMDRRRMTLVKEERRGWIQVSWMSRASPEEEEEEA